MGFSLPGRVPIRSCAGIVQPQITTYFLNEKFQWSLLLLCFLWIPDSSFFRLSPSSFMTGAISSSISCCFLRMSLLINHIAQKVPISGSAQIIKRYLRFSDSLWISEPDTVFVPSMFKTTTEITPIITISQINIVIRGCFWCINKPMGGLPKCPWALYAIETGKSLQSVYLMPDSVWSAVWN